MRCRAWWPVTSSVSGDWLWLTRCWRHRVILTGPGEPVTIDHWISDNEYLWLALKGDIDGT